MLIPTLFLGYASISAVSIKLPAKLIAKILQHKGLQQNKSLYIATKKKSKNITRKKQNSGEKDKIIQTMFDAYLSLPGETFCELPLCNSSCISPLCTKDVICGRLLPCIFLNTLSFGSKCCSVFRLGNKECQSCFMNEGKEFKRIRKPRK